MRHINFTDLVIRRVINHEILRRESDKPHSAVKYGEKEVIPTPELEAAILDRLQAALGRGGNGFVLKIADNPHEEDRFFELCQGVNDLGKEEFIARSKAIADRLAAAQRLTHIPASYLIFIDAYDTEFDERPVFIAIKAETHSAFEGNQMTLISNLILSPSQDLYKVGVLYEDDNGRGTKPYPNDRYTAMVFDQSFSKTAGLTAYFYETFLGFDQDENGAIQSERFYELTKAFILAHTPGWQKINLIQELKNIFLLHTARLIHPVNFAELYLNDDDNKRLYIKQVCEKLPGSIVKDASNIDFDSSRSKVRFGGEIEVSGSVAAFQDKMEIISSREQLSKFDPNDRGFTWVKFKGRPFD
jgi:hypothetical protein